MYALLAGTVQQLVDAANAVNEDVVRLRDIEVSDELLAIEDMLETAAHWSCEAASRLANLIVRAGG